MAKDKKYQEKVARKTPPLTGRLWSQRWSFRRAVPLGDTINSHLACLGLPGLGKSALLKLLTLHAMAQRHAVLVVDTNFDTFQWCLHACIALDYAPSDVIVLDLAQPQYGVPVIDPLRMSGIPPYGCVDSLLACCRGIWRDAWGARMEDCLRHLWLTLQAAGLPLSQALPFLENEKAHKLILQKSNDYALENFWEYFWKYHRADIESSRNKLSSFLLNPFIKPVFDSIGSTIDLYDAFNQGKIVLVNISNTLFKDESSRGFLGATILHMAFNALVQREQDNQRRPVSLLLDECHEYWGDGSFTVPILKTGRKYGAGLKLFTQSLGSFEKSDVETLFDTVGTLVSFGVSDVQAKRIVDEIFTFRSDTMVKSAGEGKDIYGFWGKKEYYSTGDQRSHALAELKEQRRQEVVAKLRKINGSEVWLAQVSELPVFKVEQSVEQQFRAESAQYHCRTP